MQNTQSQGCTGEEKQGQRLRVLMSILQQGCLGATEGCKRAEIEMRLRKVVPETVWPSPLVCLWICSTLA